MRQCPIYYNHPATDFWFTSKYIDGPVEPLYPFGFGLSYTTFDYTDLVVNCSAEHVTIRVAVKNTGERSGEEIVQCFIGDVVASRVRLVKALKGFQKIALAPSEQRTVTFELPVAELGFYNVDMQYVVEPGKFKVWVGPNSAEGLEGEFELYKFKSDCLK